MIVLSFWTWTGIGLLALIVIGAALAIWEVWFPDKLDKKGRMDGE